MKASIAAFVVAVEAFVAQSTDHRDSVAFMLTSDEEGPGTDGTIRVVEMLRRIGQQIDYCLVGEPTSENRLGDTVKNGRRGSLSATLKVSGVQGHVAYPSLADNPIHRFAPALQALLSEEWDTGNEYFSPTRLQISNMHAGSGATNVIPGELTLALNFRYGTASTADSLTSRVDRILRRHLDRYELAWQHGAHPFLTEKGRLLDAVTSSIQTVIGLTPVCSTSGGTSDGRFLATMGAEVVEFGPPNGTIHKVDEFVDLADVCTLTQVYGDILERLVR
ncbi:succinyl-diaminopimelate desuccinylase [Cupriavidus necator]|nr:succinyl-diaminopimelate desuccinylase [Cupriavidus necator]